jgi:hypothetical protein
MHVIHVKHFLWSVGRFQWWPSLAKICKGFILLLKSIVALDGIQSKFYLCPTPFLVLSPVSILPNKGTQLCLLVHCSSLSVSHPLFQLEVVVSRHPDNSVSHNSLEELHILGTNYWRERVGRNMKCWRKREFCLVWLAGAHRQTRCNDPTESKLHDFTHDT